MKRKVLSIILSITLFLATCGSFSTLDLMTSAETVTYERDETWYDPSKTILEINDISDFLEFMYQLEVQGTSDNGAYLSATGNLAAISWKDLSMPFEGQTILLTNDIVLNAGIDFSAVDPATSGAYCIERKSKQIGFGGTFDGQGHTISGLYISSTNGTGGSIFGVAGAATKYPKSNVTVKNLQIKNSYIASTSRGVATIFASAAFNTNVRIENVYSEAHLHSNIALSNDGVIIGGLCANVGGMLTIDNSVYAGTISISESGATVNKRFVGGLVGLTSNKTISNVYYHGVVNVQASAFYGTLASDKASYVGKVIGQKSASTNYTESSLTVENSILAGDMQTKTGDCIGIVAGDVTSNTKITLSNVVYTPIKNNGSNVTAALGDTASTVSTTGSIVSVAQSAITGDKSASGLGNGLDLYWISGAEKSGLPLPLGIVSTFTDESLNHDFVTNLPSTKAALIEMLGAKKAGNEYTSSSYAEYVAVYDSIVDTINSDKADLAAIDVSALKAEAEAKLVTLADKRAELFELLGAKKPSDQYTEESYAEYSAAYDDIVTSINSSRDPETVNVLELRANAEALLSDDLPKTDAITNNGDSVSNDLIVDYENNMSYEAVYSVDIIWNDLSFTYNEGSNIWDPATHTYGTVNEEPRWTDNSGEITVVNHSTEGVAISVSFEKASNGTAALNIDAPSFTLDTAVNTTVANAPKKSVAITATGVPTSDAVIGKICVTVGKTQE